MALQELLASYNFAIMDIESIQSTKEHKCIRKISILAKDGFTDITREFTPCRHFHELEEKYRKAFLYFSRTSFIAKKIFLFVVKRTYQSILELYFF